MVNFSLCVHMKNGKSSIFSSCMLVIFVVLAYFEFLYYIKESRYIRSQSCTNMIAGHDT